MDLSNILTICAIIIGPVVAVQLTRHLDASREIKNRKLNIFKVLMATRNYNTTWDHVQALNQIDLEFDKRIPAEKDVIEAWKAYLDLLGTDEMPPEQWAVKRLFGITLTIDT